MSSDILTWAAWRKSSFSGANGGSEDCVEVAVLDDGRAALRHSKHPDCGTVIFGRGEMAAFITGIKGDEFDDLTGDLTRSSGCGGCSLDHAA